MRTQRSRQTSTSFTILAAVATAAGFVLFSSVPSASWAQTVTVGTNSVVLAGPSGLYPAVIRQWAATNSYTVGSVVRDGGVYICRTAGGGAATNAPYDTHTDGYVWVRCLPSRVSLFVSNTSTNDLYLGVGVPAVTGSGVFIPAGESLLLSPSPDVAVSAVASGSGTVVPYAEW